MYLILILAFSYCTNENNRIVFFKKGELCKTDDNIDSIRNFFYSKFLKEANEKSLKDIPNGITSFRLIVYKSFYNPYCIRIDHNDSMTSVTFKMAGDRNNSIRTGLKKLNFEYESDTPQMDSLYNILKNEIISYDFYPGADDPIDYVIADGTTYLLESMSNGIYKVVAGRDNDPEYKGGDVLLSTVKKMHSFVPYCLLTDLDKAKVMDDLLFTVFKSDSLR
jgi:hypothetical protein